MTTEFMELLQIIKPMFAKNIVNNLMHMLIIKQQIDIVLLNVLRLLM